MIAAENKQVVKNWRLANHWRGKGEASVDCRYDVLIGPAPVRSFTIGYDFPCHDSIAPNVWRGCKLAICNRFWCSPPYWYLSTLTAIIQGHRLLQIRPTVNIMLSTTILIFNRIVKQAYYATGLKHWEKNCFRTILTVIAYSKTCKILSIFLL